MKDITLGGGSGQVWPEGVMNGSGARRARPYGNGGRVWAQKKLEKSLLRTEGLEWPIVSVLITVGWGEAWPWRGGGSGSGESTHGKIDVGTGGADGGWCVCHSVEE